MELANILGGLFFIVVALTPVLIAVAKSKGLQVWLALAVPVIWMAMLGYVGLSGPHGELTRLQSIPLFVLAALEVVAGAQLCIRQEGSPYFFLSYVAVNFLVTLLVLLMFGVSMVRG